MNKQHLSSYQHDDVIIVNQLLHIMNRHLKAYYSTNSLDIIVLNFVTSFAHFLYLHSGVNEARIAELLSSKPDQPMLLKLFSAYQNNAEETEWTLGCPAPSVPISLKHIRLKLHEVHPESLPESGKS